MNRVYANNSFNHRYQKSILSLSLLNPSTLKQIYMQYHEDANENKIRENAGSKRASASGDVMRWA